MPTPGDILDSHAESVSRIVPADLSHVGSLRVCTQSLVRTRNLQTFRFFAFVRIYVLALAHACLSRDL